MAGELAGMADSSLQGMVLHSPASTALAWREVGLLLLAIGLASGGARRTTLALFGATLALAAFTHVGHTAAHAERWLLSVLLLFHLFVVAFWFGALWPLHVVTARESPAIAARVVEGFSALALWLVPGLFIAGFVLGALVLGSTAALATTYGQLVIAKIAGFALLMLLASLNKWRLGPALAHGGPRAGAAFRRSVLVEYILIAAIFVLTATLTSFYSPEG
jgi:putative copper resistance protein D